jgi:3-deoxy-D-manno-octulosonic-acid transferase
MILSAFRDLVPRFPDLALILAPRDRHRFSLTYRYAQDFFPGSAARRSKSDATDQNAKVFILDTLGELEKFYSVADLALIGKSWPGHHEGGGHNPLEASTRRKPVIAGPKVHNFKWIYEALGEAGGALIVEKKDLVETLATLLADPPRLKAMGEAGQDFVARRRGAAKATLKILNAKAAS